MERMGFEDLLTDIGNSTVLSSTIHNFMAIYRRFMEILCFTLEFLE